MQAGMILYTAASSAPTGFLKADGSVLNRVDYPDLFTAIGTFYGEGDGQTTFKLPDLRGEWVRGWDNGRGVDEGRGFGEWKDGEAGNLPVSSTSNGTAAVGNYYGFDSLGNRSYTLEPDEDTYMGADENIVRNVALLAIIKI